MRKLTDKSLAQEAEKKRFERDERLNDTVHLICRVLLWLVAVFACLFYCYIGGIYCRWLYDNSTLSHETVMDIQAIFTHTFAAGGGYISSFLKKRVS